MSQKRIVTGMFLCAALFLSGCGPAAEPPRETEAVTEAETQAEAVDAPRSGDSWPKAWTGNLPEPVFESVRYNVGEPGSDLEGSVTIELKGMPDGDGYIETLIGEGYSSMTHMKVGDGVNFIGVNEAESVRIQVTYNYALEECSIVYGGM